MNHSSKKAFICPDLRRIQAIVQAFAVIMLLVGCASSPDLSDTTKTGLSTKGIRTDVTRLAQAAFSNPQLEAWWKHVSARILKKNEPVVWSQELLRMASFNQQSAEQTQAKIYIQHPVRLGQLSSTWEYSAANLPPLQILPSDSGIQSSRFQSSIYTYRSLRPEVEFATGTGMIPTPQIPSSANMNQGFFQAAIHSTWVGSLDLLQVLGLAFLMFIVMIPLLCSLLASTIANPIRGSPRPRQRAATEVGKPREYLVLGA